MNSRDKAIEMFMASFEEAEQILKTTKEFQYSDIQIKARKDAQEWAEYLASDEYINSDIEPIIRPYKT